MPHKTQDKILVHQKKRPFKNEFKVFNYADLNESCD